MRSFVACLIDDSAGIASGTPITGGVESLNRVCDHASFQLVRVGAAAATRRVRAPPIHGVKILMASR